MGLLIIQILKWILRIILLLVLLLLAILVIILVVPIRYEVEGRLQEKKPSVQGKVTWFFHLIHVKFQYMDDFHIILKVLGMSVFDSDKPKKEAGNVESDGVRGMGESAAPDSANMKLQPVESIENPEQKDIQASIEKNSEGRISESEAERKSISEKNTGRHSVSASKAEESNTAENTVSFETRQIEEEQTKEKTSVSDKIENILNKIKDVIEKIKDIIQKIKNGKLKAEHYYELWKREETQITFRRCKKKLSNMVKAVLPRKWNLTGKVGFDNPAATGQMMAGLGVLYPILGNRVQICPDFEQEIMNLDGYVKGHIRIGSLVYQVVSLLLNKYCFAFIKLIFNEISNMKKKQEMQEV